MTRQKWLVSMRIKSRKALFLIDTGVKIGGQVLDGWMWVAVISPVWVSAFPRERERESARERASERERER